ncbi:MAG: GldG family protein [Pseudomonadota bacterium]
MKRTNALITILTVLIVLLAANFLISRHPLRLDLTQKRLYTLSDSTKKILKGLDDVVTVRVYFTTDLPPAMQSLRRDVDDLLSEFKGFGGSRLQIEFIDPGSSVMEEQKVSMMGIPPVQVNVVERDKQSVAKIYLGMAVMFGDKQQVIPVVRDADNLEYDLSEAIIKVSTKELPRIAWWEPGRGEAPEGEGFSLIENAMSRRYSVVHLQGKDLADLDAKKFAALVLASPRKMSDDEIFAFDQYLMGGGKVIALVDRFDVGAQLNLIPLETSAADPVAHYGAEVEDSVVADQSNAMAAFSGGVVTYHVPYAYWPQIRREQFIRTEPIVAGLEAVVLPWTSPIKLSSSGANDRSEKAIAVSTELAVAVPENEARLDPQSANGALIHGERGSKTFLALLSGPFGSYFAPGKSVPPKGRQVIAESVPGARLFVAGSSRWVSDRVLQTFPQNAALFQNALDAFAMGDLLIGIRSREGVSRPVAILSDGARAIVKYSNLVVGPLVVVAIGLVLYMIRRSRRRAIQAMYK